MLPRFRFVPNARHGQLLGLSLGALLIMQVGCGSDVDTNGEYTLSLTNRENGCQFDNWTEGETATNVPLTMVQDGSSVTGTVGGGGGIVLGVILGSNEFTGDVSGNDIDMQIVGENSATEGNCAFTANATVDAELDGDVMTGNIRYEFVTNGNPDCDFRDDCQSRQEFNGTRPPQ